MYLFLSVIGTMCPTSVKCLFLWITLMVYFSAVECLSCVQCSSINNPDCIGGQLDPKECLLPNSTYCIKYEGKVQHINLKLVVRECSDKNEPSECEVKTIRDEPVNVCFYSCTSNGCNGNSATTISTVSTVFLLITCSLTLGFVHAFGPSSL